VASNWQSALQDSQLREVWKPEIRPVTDMILGCKCISSLILWKLVESLNPPFPKHQITRINRANLTKFVVLFYEFEFDVIITVGNYWLDTANRRLFFEKFAKSHKFDPLLPYNWYSISIDHILPVKVTQILTMRFNSAYFLF
jgi:hypothetical protein